MDAIGRAVSFSYPPQRIVSLCPSVTETLYHFGLEDRIVGRTRFCIHPEKLVKMARNVGGTKQVDLNVIRTLSPDLIIAVKEENTREMIEMLEKEYPVYVLDVESALQGLEMIAQLGEITASQTAAKAVIDDIAGKGGSD